MSRQIHRWPPHLTRSRNFCIREDELDLVKSQRLAKLFVRYFILSAFGKNRVVLSQALRAGLICAGQNLVFHHLRWKQFRVSQWLFSSSLARTFARVRASTTIRCSVQAAHRGWNPTLDTGLLRQRKAVWSVIIELCGHGCCTKLRPWPKDEGRFRGPKQLSLKLRNWSVVVWFRSDDVNITYLDTLN